MGTVCGLLRVLPAAGRRQCLRHPLQAPARRAVGGRCEMAAAWPGHQRLRRRLPAARKEPQDHRPGQPAQQPSDRRGQGQRF